MASDRQARSCFRTLAQALGEHLSDPELRAGYEASRDQIALLFQAQPDVPVTQDSLAGFLNGFLLALAEFAGVDLVNQKNDEMFPVIGGIYLLGANAPISCRPSQLDAVRAGFFHRLSGPLIDDLQPQPAEVEQVYAIANEQIRKIFGTTPDVPVNRESLAGLVLGIMHTHQYVPDVDGEGLTALMVAAYLLANRSDSEAINGDGPELW